MREKFEKFNFSPLDIDSSIEREREKIHVALLSHIEKSLDDPDCEVGEGSIARVLRIKMPSHEKMLCAKFIDTSRTVGTIDYQSRFGEIPTYNNLETEAEFLDTLKNIHPDVRVPEPYYFWEKRYKEKGTEQTKSFLSMELLNAVTLEDVFRGVESMPKNFNQTIFFGKLREFITRMHDKGVNHQDIQERNVLVDRNSGDPRVVDFGSAEWRESQVDSDESGVNQLERLVEEFLTKSVS